MKYLLVICVALSGCATEFPLKKHQGNPITVEWADTKVCQVGSVVQTAEECKL